MAHSSTVRSLVQQYAPESGAAAKQRILLELAQRLNVVVGEFELGRAGLSGELALDLDEALIAGGDSRLRLDATTRLNKYGTAPRPRPEAVQFSSSTASSISEHSYALCRELLATLQARAAGGQDVPSIQVDLADRVRAEIARQIVPGSRGADVVLAASGTDTEALTVLLSLAADERPITSLLMAPEESGRGVLLAGRGCWFDGCTARGATVEAGGPIWPRRQIEVATVTIRGVTGRPRLPEDIGGDVLRLAHEALERGHRLLLHVLLGSKTGLTAPNFDLVRSIVRAAPEQVDVVVDACQLRVSPSVLTGLVDEGWMLQVTGSKFFTGPPFSGALIVPSRLRGRAAAVGALMAEAPALTGSEDWPAEWRSGWPTTDKAGSFGPLLRWTAALAEGALLEPLDRTQGRLAFARIAEALRKRVEDSTVLLGLRTPEFHMADLGDALPGLGSHAIIGFAIAPETADGDRPFWPLADCQRAFELLNRDVRPRLPDLSDDEAALAGHLVHIGQPVQLRPDVPTAPTVLRLVLGARFFTIVGYAEDHEKALQSQIDDALLAIDKLELLIRHWDSLQPAAA